MSFCMIFIICSVVRHLARDYFYGAQVNSAQTFSCGLCWEDTQGAIRSQHCMRKTNPHSISNKRFFLVNHSIRGSDVIPRVALSLYCNHNFWSRQIDVGESLFILEGGFCWGFFF